MAEIFDLESDIAINEPEIEVIKVSTESLKANLRLPFNIARRIQEAKSVLNNHSLLALQAHENDEPLSLSRAKNLARLNPKWTPELEKELFSTRNYLKTIDPTKSTVTLVTPSASMIDTLEETRPASYTSSFSPSSFKSPSRLRFRDQ